MDIERIMTFCEQFIGVTSDFPFGLEPKCYRVGGKIFTEIFPTGVPGALRILLEDETISRDEVTPMVTIRCEAAYGDFLRHKYPGTVLRPYHCPPAQQPYANTVLLNGTVPDDVLKDMIDHAYTRIFQKLPKKTQHMIRV